MLEDGVDPADIKVAPELNLGLDLYYEAFWCLTTCRSLGMGIGPIPWTAVMEYCDRYQIEDDQRDDMVYHINQMDDAYRKHVERQVKNGART